jgi:hypothetical protein
MESEHARHHSSTGIFIMIRHQRVLAIFIASVLLTDAAVAAETVAANIKILSSTGHPHTAKKTHGATRERASAQNRRAALDASTVSDAKASLLAMDEVSALLRQQALARRSARAESRWKLW